MWSKVIVSAVQRMGGDVFNKVIKRKPRSIKQSPVKIPVVYVSAMLQYQLFETFYPAK